MTVHILFSTSTNSETLPNKGVKRIYAAARKTDDLEQLAGDLIVPVKLDITNLEQVKAAAEQANDVTILINNAGVLTGGSLLDRPVEEINRNFETNFFGTLNMIRAFAPVIERSGGAIANVLSVVSMASMAGLGGYSASKAAAFSLTQAVRAELKTKRLCTGSAEVVTGLKVR